MKKPGIPLQNTRFHSWSQPGARAPKLKENQSMDTPITQDNTPRKTKFTFEEAVDVWLRRWSGQLQHEIAAAYIINSGRVSDVLNEVTHVGSKEVAASRRSA